MISRRTTVVALGCALLALTASQSLADEKDKERKKGGWGEVVDPDGDCQFQFKKKAVKISVPGSVHGMSIERGKVNAPRVWTSASGDFRAQVKVTGDFPQGAESLVASRKPFHGAGLIAHSDDDNYVRLERAELVAGNKNHSYTSFEVRTKGAWTRAGKSGEYPLRPESPTWLRLERRGDWFHAAVSQDGEKWIELDAIKVQFSEHLKVGVMVGHDTSSPIEVTFSEFALEEIE